MLGAPIALCRAHSISRGVERSQPGRAFGERLLLVVPVFERALYSLGDDELEPGRVLALARESERRVLGVESPRPLLSIPHLLNQESAASYHGYLLAAMAVYQVRAWFLNRYGYIADNPAVGPLLAEKCWAPGNSRSLDRILRDLTGEGFTGSYLAESCRASAAEAWSAAELSIVAARSRSYPESYSNT